MRASLELIFSVGSTLIVGPPRRPLHLFPETEDVATVGVDAWVSLKRSVEAPARDSIGSLVRETGR